MMKNHGLALALTLAVLPACNRSEPPTTAPMFAATHGPAALPAGVERVSVAQQRDAEALRLSGAIRMAGVEASRDVSFHVVGAPGPAPETYEAQVRDPATGGEAHLTYRPDWRSLAIGVGGHVAEISHNPDGSFSAGGQTFATLSAAAGALAADPALGALTSELLIAGAVALGDAVLAAHTRIPDGICDPLWFPVDPDCPRGFAPASVGQAYACERWGRESQGCAFFEAYTR